MLRFLLCVGAIALPAVATAAPSVETGAPIYANSTALEGVVPVHVDRTGGRILVTLPPAAADGVSLRLLYATALRTGLGAAPTFLDRGRVGPTQIIAFRRLGKRIAIQFENPRFRAIGGASSDFATSVAWMGDVAATLPDGSMVVDIAGFLTADTLGIARSLSQEGDAMGTGDRAQGAGSGFTLDDKRSAADPGSVRLFPDNLEIDAVQTFASAKPGAEVENIAPDPRAVSFTVHHSFVRLPAPGFVPRAFDQRIGGFATQRVEFGAPLGDDVVRDIANRFRLERTDPTAARSTVRKPIIFYVDRNAPEPVRTALIEGIGWWSKAFDAAGLVDAFQVKPLPEGADPLDVRYNIVNWVDRATRGWSYGQEIVDPRTGEIVKGMVVLGSLRARQDIQIFEGLVGASAIGTGGSNDPVRVALARLRQLGAHEVGHALGFAHNFAASTQDRASVMDYPAPRIGLKDGKPDLSDAYGVGVGVWDMATVDWLYGAPNDAAASAKAADVVAKGMRFVEDDNARAPDTAQPWGALWDDGADPIAELDRLMRVRRAAIDRFGPAMLAPGEPAADLRRRFVPIWLLHRYQLAAAAKSIGGVDFAYAVAGSPNAVSPPVSPERQRAALTAVLATITPQALAVPNALLPLLSSARNGSTNRQFDIELFRSAGGPVFDPLVAADVAVELAINTLLAPKRLQRLAIQHAADARALGAQEMLDRLTAAAVATTGDALSRRIAYRTIVIMAQTARRADTDPDTAALLDAQVRSIAETLAKHVQDPDGRAWASSLSRQLLDPLARERLLADRPRTAEIPPGDPIGGEADWMGDLE
ncbi:zinc-dependent metalloprotease [Sphingomonas bacterium]|nr:zinc-dependent metalloprotease [Sphingomonas bacterium]